MKKFAISSIIPLIVSLYVFSGCEKSSVSNSSTQTGKSGSITRFTIAKNYLYVVSNHFLSTYSLTDPASPKQVHNSDLNYDIETVYAYGNYLFLGTKTGLYIYSIDNPSSPALIGEAKHARSCDPVVVNDSVAFVTLKSTGNCGPAQAGLYIHDIKDLMHPLLKTTIALPDPTGLGIQDSILYVCCGSNGLKLFNINNPYVPELIDTKNDGNYLDVIPYNGILICNDGEGIILYDMSDPAKLALIKKI